MMIQGKVWGYTCPLFNKNNVELHYAKIKKGGFCSKHLHKHKFNQFMVFDGLLKVTIWKDYGLQDVTMVGKDQSCIVAPGEFHQFEALEDTTILEIYWVNLNVNDIVREGQGGVKDEEATDISSTQQRAGDRQAVFIESTYHPDESTRLYGKKYFGNDDDKVSMR